MTLIERLRKAGYDPKINVYALLPEAADAIEALQEAAFVQRGELLLALGERDALQAENERMIQEQAAWRRFTEMANNTVSKAEAERDALAAKLVPLTYAQIEQARKNWLESGEVGTAYHSAVRFAEAAHGIQAKGGQHD